jgi:hypothetical protein
MMGLWDDDRTATRGRLRGEGKPAMADVSVRFAMTDDSEIVLNLSLTQAIRLTEAIASKVSQAMSDPRGSLGGATYGAPGRPPGPYASS